MFAFSDVIFSGGVERGNSLFRGKQTFCSLYCIKLVRFAIGLVNLANDCLGEIAEANPIKLEHKVINNIEALTPKEIKLPFFIQRDKGE